MNSPITIDSTCASNDNLKNILVFNTQEVVFPQFIAENIHKNSIYILDDKHPNDCR
jgi:hypothetical protein